MNTTRYLFRGKRIDSGNWVEGYYFFNGDYHGIITNDGYDGRWDEVDPSTIGQFTGLKDKNGVNIFEGDLVKNESGRICVVVWHTNSGQWDYNVFANYDKTNANNFCNQEASRLEIVGNIHDTPELLTQQK